MKFMGREISLSNVFIDPSAGGDAFQERVIEADHGLGFSRFRTKVNVYKHDDVKDYFDAYLNNDLIRLYVDDLVEQAVGGGFYTTVDVVSPIRGTSRSKKYIDHWNKVQKLDARLVNIGKIMLIAGYCPVESQLRPGPAELSKLKIVHPLTLDTQKGVEAIDGEVLRYHQKVRTEENTIEGNNLAWFMYGEIGNNPMGVSFVRGMIKLLNILNQATADVQDILDRYIAPLAVWKSRRKIDSIKKAVQERAKNEDIFLGELQADEIAEPGLVTFYSIDPRVPFWEFIEYLDRRIYSYSRAANIWYLRNATEASAKEVNAVTDRHVAAIRRVIKRTVESAWWEKLVILNNLTEVPKMNFGVEPTGVEDLQLEPFLTKGLELAFIDEDQYWEILERFGVNITRKKAEPEGSAEPGDKQEGDEEERTESQLLLENVEPPGILEYQHSRYKCMSCSKPPTVEILWAEGKAHAWFCDECFLTWKEAHPEEVSGQRAIYGVAAEKWREHIGKEKAAEFRAKLGITKMEEAI